MSVLRFTANAYWSSILMVKAVAVIPSKGAARASRSKSHPFRTESVGAFAGAAVHYGRAPTPPEDAAFEKGIELVFDKLG